MLFTIIFACWGYHLANSWLTLGYHPDIYRLQVQGPVTTCPPGGERSSLASDLGDNSNTMGNSHIGSSSRVLTWVRGCLYLVRGCSRRAPLCIYNTKSNNNLDKLQQHHHAMTTISTLPVEVTPDRTKSKPRLGLGGAVMAGYCTMANNHLVEHQTRKVFKQKYLVYVPTSDPGYFFFHRQAWVYSISLSLRRGIGTSEYAKVPIMGTSNMGTL